MRAIVKNDEPRLLTEYRAAGGVYDGPNFTPVKDAIRLSLLIEQGYLCAYCMARITTATMKVEHWACQANNSRLQLLYSNLLGCCMGSEGDKYPNQTCDTRKGSSELKFNPSRRQDNITLLIRYDGQGKICSTDSDFNVQLNVTLNLNKSRLVENRSTILSKVRSKLGERAGRRTKTEIIRLLTSFNNYKDNGHLIEYLGVIENYLSSKL